MELASELDAYACLQQSLTVDDDTIGDCSLDVDLSGRALTTLSATARSTSTSHHLVADTQHSDSLETA